jgi:hypothetical protein
MPWELLTTTTPGEMDDLSIAGLVGMVLTRATAESNPYTVSSSLSTIGSKWTSVFIALVAVELPCSYIVAAILKTAAGLKSAQDTMAVGKSGAWHTHAAASLTTPRASTWFAPPCVIFVDGTLTSNKRNHGRSWYHLSQSKW